jgi:hypothetical protein
MYHKQSASARTLFLQVSYGGVCGFEPLPKLAQVMDNDDMQPGDSNVIGHPAQVIRNAEQSLGCLSGDLVADAEYYETVDVPGSRIAIYLARFTSIDPPYAMAEKAACRFALLTDLRALTPVELELLRRAYNVIMGG